ncbi:NnrS family protein [Terricaulis sp.]|uniref:NnrS family protein n=1 Tax=Terricaulis sp. TaxID=2768686 RepID=UPI003784E1C7
MTSTAERYRAYAGAPLFGMGFRPFFLFGATFAALALPLWIVGFHGWIPGVTRDWHVHEMLFGYLGAVIAGFLLTAVPNWTGRLPVAGAPLALLFSLWAAGRVAMLFASQSPLAAMIDSAFLFALGLIIAREIVAGRNMRNLPVCGLVFALATANALTHFQPAALLGERIGLAAVAMMVAVIGGRITPSFTRNWMAKRRMTPEPAAPGRFDLAALLVTAAGLLAWVTAPEWAGAGASLALAGIFNLARLARWKGWRTAAEPLVTILHLGYAWLAVALGLLGVSVLAPELVSRMAGVHALTAGAFGVMTLAVMTRATRGHTGRGLSADGATLAIYALVNAGAVMRVASPFLPEYSIVLVVAAATLWSAAFAAFALVYGPYLLQARAGR